MSKLRSIFTPIVLTVLMAISGVLFSDPTRQADAQGTGTATFSFCVNPSNGNLLKAASGNVCPSTHELRTSFPTDARGVCLFRDSRTGKWEVIPPEQVGNDYQISTDGKKCIISDVAPADYPDFVGYSTIQTYVPPNTNNNANGNSNTGNSNTANTNTRTNTNGGGGNNNGPTQIQGDCESGFHKTGPLCVPNSPFTTGIVGDPSSQTASGLAVRLIKILLYFAGIVAVIMAIIGGYLVMTARGNETQATNGRKTLTNAIIGLVIVILSYVIIQAVISFVTT